MSPAPKPPLIELTESPGTFTPGLFPLGRLSWRPHHFERSRRGAISRVRWFVGWSPNLVQRGAARCRQRTR
jgi:hypothetical protein